MSIEDDGWGGVAPIAGTAPSQGALPRTSAEGSGMRSEESVFGGLGGRGSASDPRRSLVPSSHDRSSLCSADSNNKTVAVEARSRFAIPTARNVDVQRRATVPAAFSTISDQGLDEEEEWELKTGDTASAFNSIPDQPDASLKVKETNESCVQSNAIMTHSSNQPFTCSTNGAEPYNMYPSGWSQSAVPFVSKDCSTFTDHQQSSVSYNSGSMDSRPRPSHENPYNGEHFTAKSNDGHDWEAVKPISRHTAVGSALSSAPKSATNISFCASNGPQGSYENVYSGNVSTADNDDGWGAITTTSSQQIALSSWKVPPSPCTMNSRSVSTSNGTRTIHESCRSEAHSTTDSYDGWGTKNSFAAQQITSSSCEMSLNGMKSSSGSGFGGGSQLQAKVEPSHAFGGVDRNSSFGNFNNSGAKNFTASSFACNDNNFGTKSGCRNCGEDGHFARECPQKRVKDGPMRCYNCGEEGHLSSECSSPRKEPMCYNCRQEGHISASCPEPKRERLPTKCFNCNEDGHVSTDCPHPQRERKPAADFVPDEIPVDKLIQDTTHQAQLQEKFYGLSVQFNTNSESCDESRVESFADMGLGKVLVQNLAKIGYSKPSPVQQGVIPLVIRGEDVMAIAQTGCGKSAAYILPLLHNIMRNNQYGTANQGCCKPRCLVMCPTHELTDQIYNDFKKFGHNTTVVPAFAYGGLAVSQNTQVLMQGITVLIATPGRLIQYLNSNIVSLDQLEYFVLDEADRMVDEVKGFSEDIRIVSEKIGSHPHQTLMLSATFPVAVVEIAKRLLKPNFVTVTVGKAGAANDCIKQEFILSTKNDKLDDLKKLLDINPDFAEVQPHSAVLKHKTLIFVKNKKFADALGVQLSESGLSSSTLHSDRNQASRHEAMRQFRSGQKAVLVATGVCERGLDIRGVDHVINYDMPNSIEEYILRIGRTGRAGQPGRATSFIVQGEDSDLISHIIKVVEEAGQEVPEFLRDAARCVMQWQPQPLERNVQADDGW